ncbi:hypothetical protein BU24DRAFT_163631 [Aaosphaeria arxii CBS 175.79]|uniref:Uncharacterized protein n=1 Tax=Aaosphaeria arxii CBS 175.79 TaxID=1450172 RepID=A0A6A5XZI2_9PLEO|nr:uncharacterized protein BU24DRAFT_163631 [Aaosphaeria arxii CBS 175.79]KAF2018030.1 hypothetical protein BU24DRAFT_163631 [Aaosphaeria arxii CBS 175.79]
MIATGGLILLGALLPALSSASPIVAAGSKHNVYLVKCQWSDCDIFCDPDDVALTAAAYFSGGPVPEGTTRAVTPTRLGRVSGQWEGTTKSVRLGTDGTFKATIPTSARTAKKGEIVGDATLGDEPFVCFKDGSSQIPLRYDGETYTCTTDYWCPSISVGETA